MKLDEYIEELFTRSRRERVKPPTGMRPEILDRDRVIYDYTVTRVLGLWNHFTLTTIVSGCKGIPGPRAPIRKPTSLMAWVFAYTGGSSASGIH